MTPVLDICCGSRMFWFDKKNTMATFCDKRTENHILCDGRSLEISPDIECDFRELPFNDNTFKLVVFDPPHLHKAGGESWMVKKYGCLDENWKDDLRLGFSECFRVLDMHGVLIFKWNESQIPVRDVLSLTDVAPLFGHRSGKRSGTHWITFMKV